MLTNFRRRKSYKMNQLSPSANPPRRTHRRGRSPTLYAGTTELSMNDDSDYNEFHTVEPMDEDDQKALVEKLRKDATEQTRFFQLLFGYGVGGFGCVLAIALPILCHDECQSTLLECWGHSTVSFGLHVLSVYPFVSPTIHSVRDSSRITVSSPTDETERSNSLKPSTTKNTSNAESKRTRIYYIVLQLIPCCVWLMGDTGDDPDHFHLVLLIGNAISFLGSLVLLWDIDSTNKALADLESSQYKHKSL